MIWNYIGGEWVESFGKETVDVIDPATEALLGKTPLGTEKDVENAVEAANKAFQEWRSCPAVDRVQYLFRLKNRMEEELDLLSEMITKEHGKTVAESRGSVRRAIQMVETACGIPSLMMGENFEDIARGIDSSSVRRPMGVFAGIAPFNFPAMVPFWFWPFAVACGNTFVLKPSERVPLTSLRIFEILDELGFPPGVMNMVHGGKEVVDSLCTHPKVKGVSFVGSTPVAKHVYTLGCASGKRVQALGGAKNLMVVMPDSLEKAFCDRTVSTAIESITGCAGERCLAGSLVLCVGKETYKSFEEKAVQFAKKIKVGSGFDPETMMGPLISKEAKARVEGLIERAVKEGAKLLLDGRKDSEAYFLKPTVLSGIKAEMEIAQEEIFGPVILIGEVSTLKESVDWINSLPYGNTTTLFTQSGAHARYFSYHVDPSMIGINIGVPAPMSFFSFGGSKASFFGDIKAHGASSVDFFTDTYTTIYRWYSDSGIWAK